MYKEELKSCPFCGGKASYYKAGASWMAKCTRCGISKLSESWNKRAVQPTQWISDIEKAYIAGYEEGHDDTVESCYGCFEDKAEEYAKTEAPREDK